MHVLTKIFIVLVALLSVMLVPLVVVYAKNEDSFKTRYADADSSRVAANATLQSAMQNHASEVTTLENRIAQLQAESAQRQASLSQKDGEIARLQSELSTEKTRFAQMNTKLGVITSTIESAQNLVNQLVAEAGELRSNALAAERQNAEITVTLQEQGRQLEVAEAAVRSLQEEVQRLSEAEAQATHTIAKYQAQWGDLPGTDYTGLTGMGEPIDVKVLANITAVREANGVMLAEIDAGQRDGVKVGWVMTIGDGQGNYVGRLRIIEVDVNSATGVAETASGGAAMTRAGHRAYAFPN